MRRLRHHRVSYARRTLRTLSRNGAVALHTWEPAPAFVWRLQEAIEPTTEAEFRIFSNMANNQNMKHSAVMAALRWSVTIALEQSLKVTQDRSSACNRRLGVFVLDAHNVGWRNRSGSASIGVQQTTTPLIHPDSQHLCAYSKPLLKMSS